MKGTIKPTVLGCDPGPQHTAFGVVADGAILHTSMLEESIGWDDYCVTFQDTITQLRRTHLVDVLAIEDFSWYGEYAKVESPIRELIGIARTFSRIIPVKVIPITEWSQAITGERPRPGTLYGTTHVSWKKTIRKALALRCQEMGLDLEAVVGKDPGNHQVDAISLALYCQDCMWIEGHTRD